MGRSRSAATVAAYLMRYRVCHGKPPSLLECIASIASRRRITAMNYGFVARLCDLELALGAEKTSLPLVWWFRLHQTPQTGIFPYSPAPDYCEILREAKHVKEA